MNERIAVLKPTQDNWYPSYAVEGSYNGVRNQMMVEVKFHGNIRCYDSKINPVWRTSVWGADDCGMDFDCETESECWDKFIQVLRMNFVNRDELIKLGFVYA